MVSGGGVGQTPWQRFAAHVGASASKQSHGAKPGIYSYHLETAPDSATCNCVPKAKPRTNFNAATGSPSQIGANPGGLRVGIPHDKIATERRRVRETPRGKNQTTANHSKSAKKPWQTDISPEGLQSAQLMACNLMRQGRQRQHNMSL